MQISREDCKLVTLTDIATEARACSAHTITGHWTAGRYKQYFSDYHLLINDEGEILMPNGITLDSVLAHTYGRNTGNIGVSMCCCLDAIIYRDGSVNFGSVPPTFAQIDAMAKIVAVITKCAPKMTPFGVTANTFRTHSEWAEMDGYGLYSGDADMRWDLIKLEDLGADEYTKPGGDVIRGKAIWHTYNNPDVYNLVQP